MDKRRKLKIVFVLPNLQSGGAERVMLNLMNNLDRERFTPIVITLNGTGMLRSKVATDISFYDLQARLSCLALLRLHRKIDRLRPDVIVSTMARVNFLTLLLRPLFPATRFIVREAALPSMIFKSRNKIAGLIHLLYRALYPLANAVIDPAQAIMEEFKNFAVPLHNHIKIYNPVNTQALRATIPATMSQDDAGTLHFIAAGSFYWPKGFDRLIEALSITQPPAPWHLTILGDGKDRPLLESLIEKHNLQANISLPGFTDKPAPLFAQAHCFLLPSRSEGMPNVALEALACGTKVLAMREAGGITDIANLTGPDIVILTETIEDFVSQMARVERNSAPIPRPSLLPQDFDLQIVMEQFSILLEDATFGNR